MRKLTELGLRDEDSPAEPPPKVLEELTVNGVVKHIQKLQASDNSKKL